jgi:squalene-hopene/tetraprenyl-beta-curcumene cyclase
MHRSATQAIVDPADNGPQQDSLDERIEAASRALRRLQRGDGHWLFELEADATIPAEYILLIHYLGETADLELEQKIGRYLRRNRTAGGGWPLFHKGAFDISASVKAYFALKMIGDDPSKPHMREARQAILQHGGAAAANVFTRILLALYGIVPWTSLPQMPVELMLAPRWFPFHLSKISYWARTVIVPLLVLSALKPRAKNPRGVSIEELFILPPERTGPPLRAEHQSRGWAAFFRMADAALRRAEPYFPTRARQRAIAAALEFVRERLNGTNGLGAIFPAMANAVMMFDALGYPPDHPERAVARQALEGLVFAGDEEAYVQPCLSPVWDTVLSCHALLEAGDDESRQAAVSGLEWLRTRQECDVVGDWAVQRPGLAPGGWAFQYTNPHYPDLDDTAVIVMAMERMQRDIDDRRYDAEIRRAVNWIAGLQSRDGGWAAFDADNTHEFLNNIPFSDHGALLDPPSPDLTARCVHMLAAHGASPENSAQLRAGIANLRRSQRPDGSWYGRWGVNYIYGTWSALCALGSLGYGLEDPAVRRAVDWLLSIQNEDGGWGESADSYRLDYACHSASESTVTQTSWALLGLLAVGLAGHGAVRNGIGYLLDRQDSDGLWDEPHYTGTGFPRVFYLRYHGYAKYFPLWALARYRILMRSNTSLALL